jgi:predicted transposase YbfD/YdcC
MWPDRSSGHRRQDLAPQPQSKTGHKALHPVSAFATTGWMVRRREAVDEKSNEITGIAALLERLDLECALVSIDALQSQHRPVGSRCQGRRYAGRRYAGRLEPAPTYATRRRGTTSRRRIADIKSYAPRSGGSRPSARIEARTHTVSMWSIGSAPFVPIRAHPGF